MPDRHVASLTPTSFISSAAWAALMLGLVAVAGLTTACGDDEVAQGSDTGSVSDTGEQVDTSVGRDVSVDSGSDAAVVDTSGNDTSVGADTQVAEDTSTSDTGAADTTTSDVSEDSGVDLGTGGEDCTNGADDDGDERVDCHDPNCFDTDPCIGVNPAPFLTPRHWRLSFSDEFNGPEPGNEDCYDNDTTPPQCLTLYWHNETCPERAFANLADLNKCDWSVFSMYNWMDWGKVLGEGVNAFDPEDVSVVGGELILRARASIPEGGLSSGAPIGTIMNSYECGIPPDEGYRISVDCPILSGGLWSKQMGAVDGMIGTYGRFEARARLPVGPGSWPAHWLLPQEGPWPGDGEIDIMEAINYQPDWTPHAAGANFHDGVTIEIDGMDVNTHMSVGSMDQAMTPAEQTDEYHIFSVEWEAEQLRFYVDSHLIGTVDEGTMLPNNRLDDVGGFAGDFPVQVPDEDFHWILNSTIAAFGANDYPDPRTFGPQYHYIDYVRTWELCDAQEDYCPLGGNWDGANCRLGELPAREDLFMHEGDVVYPAAASAPACPDGERDGDLCLVHAAPEGAYTFMHGSGFYAQTACLESTLSDSPRCYHPCAGVGVYDGQFCIVGHPPEGAGAMIVDDRLGYSPLIGDGVERCPVGRDRGTYCEIGAIPDGRTASLTFDRDVFRLSAICQPAAFMPNCPEPCPQDTRWDGLNCVVGQAPAGSSPFIYEGGFYYSYLNTGTYATRCPTGVDDSANCFVGRLEGWTPALVGETFVVSPACGTVPPLSND